jgi:hypothetical protein
MGNRWSIGPPSIGFGSFVPHLVRCRSRSSRSESCRWRCARRLGASRSSRVRRRSRFVSYGARLVRSGSRFVSDGARLVRSGSRFVTDGACLVGSGSWFVSDGARLVRSGSRFVSNGARLVGSGSRFVRDRSRIVGTELPRSPSDLAPVEAPVRSRPYQATFATSLGAHVRSRPHRVDVDHEDARRGCPGVADGPHAQCPAYRYRLAVLRTGVFDSSWTE